MMSNKKLIVAVIIMLIVLVVQVNTDNEVEPTVDINKWKTVINRGTKYEF